MQMYKFLISSTACTFSLILKIFNVLLYYLLTDFETKVPYQTHFEKYETIKSA